MPKDQSRENEKKLNNIFQDWQKDKIDNTTLYEKVRSLLWEASRPTQPLTCGDVEIEDVKKMILFIRQNIFLPENDKIEQLRKMIKDSVRFSPTFPKEVISILEDIARGKLQVPDFEKYAVSKAKQAIDLIKKLNNKALDEVKRLNGITK